MGTILPDVIEPSPVNEKEKIGWDEPENKDIPWIEPAKNNGKTLPKLFTRAMVIIFSVIFIFIFAKAIFGQPTKFPEKFRPIDLSSIPANCRYPGLTVQY